MTDVRGLLRDPHGRGTLIRGARQRRAAASCARIIQGGMIPKVGAVEAVRRGVRRVYR